MLASGLTIAGRLNARNQSNAQSSSGILLVDPRKLTAKRTITADVASRRQRTAVAIKALLSEYGSMKFGMIPSGGVRAGTSLGLAVFIMLSMLLEDEECRSEEGEVPAEQVYHSHQRHSSWLSASCSLSFKAQSPGALSLQVRL